jgi:calcineurin-like phosphoesterase family protein
MGTLLVGDIHGQFDRFNKICRKNPDDIVIQLGDYGLFPNPKDIKRNIPSNAKFCAGNHDDRKVCQLKPNYLGDYGLFQDVFFLSGAASTDKHLRTEGVDWFAYEELSIVELNAAIDLYTEIQPNILIAHDAPSAFGRHLLDFKIKINRLPNCTEYLPTRTSQALDRMIEIHPPSLFYCGHWHISQKITLDRTNFRCLKEFEICALGE